MKRLTALLLAILILSFAGVNVYAEGKGIGWYVKRNGRQRPVAIGEMCEIEDYGGYYIDKKLSDDSEKRVIYLTFDAGYDNGNVTKTVEILKEKNVKAAFFILDTIVIKNTDLLCRMFDDGHLVCNHTKNHKDVTLMTNDEIIDNLTDLERICEQKTGRKMAKYFRFPEGKYSIDSLKTVNELGYKTIFWSFGYDDWDNARQPDKSTAFKKIIDNTHNGEVILLHPTSSTNVEILPLLIDKWREMGYSFGSLDELVKE
ncbi:MAG: delta-lactam-biosynthetic de-N-acetylase [Ruminococcaceae bacterium]|nr:delta-lactam-biosynthetic de-N-acetylase [Oscillospiraceae bacterium]